MTYGFRFPLDRRNNLGTNLMSLQKVMPIVLSYQWYPQLFLLKINLILSGVLKYMRRVRKYNSINL